MISAGAFLSKQYFENYTIRCFSKCGEEHRRVMDMVPLHYQDVFSATVFFLASCANILTNIMFNKYRAHLVRTSRPPGGDGGLTWCSEGGTSKT